MQRLMQYFSVGSRSQSERLVGAEIETSFITKSGAPISIEQSQQLFRQLVRSGSWSIAATKGVLISQLTDQAGNQLLYELGRQNIELASMPLPKKQLVPYCQNILGSIYKAAETVGAFPYFEPVLQTNENLLVIPDERDAIWLLLDGKPALNALANISAVQFTIDVQDSAEAIRVLNNLGEHIRYFLLDYPQELQWRYYIQHSQAGYNPLRFGGPLLFESLRDYCAQLSKHDVISGTMLTPFGQSQTVDIPLFIRSVWWYFRLKRYGNGLCVEVRPLARRSDEYLTEQLELVLDLI